MRDNVTRALNNVEQLEDMEEKAADMDSQARRFKKTASAVKSMFRCRYYKITVILVLAVLAIVAWIGYAIYKKVH